MDRRILATLGGIALVISACSSSGAAIGARRVRRVPPRPPPERPARRRAGPARWPSRSRTSRSTRPTITAKVGDTVTFTNTGAAPHTATLDAGGCTTSDHRSRAGSMG